MEEKKIILPKVIIIIGSLVLTVVLGFGVKTVINYQNGKYNEERPHGSISCDPGWYWDVKIGDCNKCEAGSFTEQPGQTYCQPCSSGFYQDEEGQESCKPCGEGMTTDGTGSTSPSDCKTSAPSAPPEPSCDPGSYRNGTGGCLGCSQGYYCPDGVDQISCSGTVSNDKTACANISINGADSVRVNETISWTVTVNGNNPDSYTPISGSTQVATVSKTAPNKINVTGKMVEEEDIYINLTYNNKTYNASKRIKVKCASGFYENNSACTPCEEGYYCYDGTKAQCPTNSTSSNGAIYLSDCKCNDGYYMDGGSCKLCEAGNYCKNNSKVACQSNEYQNQTGQASCKSCSGTVNNGKSACLSFSCTPNSIFVGGTSTCRSTYNGELKSNGVSYTLNKNIGSINQNNGIVTSNATGTLEITATYVGIEFTTMEDTIIINNAPAPQACVPGMYSTGGGCENCPAGSYQDQGGQESCKPCTGNEYTNTQAATEPKICSGATNHSSCLTLSGNDLISVGATTKITPEYDGSANAEFTWTSSDPEVASINNMGVVTGISPGNVTITATKINETSLSETMSIIVSANAVECKPTVTITSVKTSIDIDNQTENSFYEVSVTVNGTDCANQTLTYTATNSKSIVPTSATVNASGDSFTFKVYPRTACTYSIAMATLTNGKKDSKAVDSIVHDWIKETGCWTVAQIGNYKTTSQEADALGHHHYYTEWDSESSCYREHYHRNGCGSSTPSTENPACYMNKSTGLYFWGKYKNDNNYQSLPEITSEANCKPSEEGGTGEKVYACYKNDNNDYQWAETAPSGYTLVETIRDEADCKLDDDAACYRDTEGKYKWGNYANNKAYTLIENIKNAEDCATPEACYVDGNGEFVWGNYAYNENYSLAANITKQADCKSDDVEVPATSATTAAIIYVSVIVMIIFGASTIYYVYKKKKLS